MREDHALGQAQCAGRRRVSLLLPMLVYQPNAKLKRGFNFRSRKVPSFTGTRAQSMQRQQSIGVRWCNPVSGQSGGQERRNEVDRPGRAIQARLEPVFYRLIAKHDDVDAR